MVVAVRTEEVDGALVVVKEARSDGDVARLTQEARALARCRHPGVVELVSVGERSLTLRHAGTALARLGPYPTDQVAGIVCAVADVVQALHRLGVVHGDLDASHVLLDDRGRPRLCGFGRAADHTPDGAADDVAALGRLLSRLLEGGADLPWARPPGGVRRRAEQRQARRDLEALAAQATREQRGQRPTARQLAKAVHAAVPGCSLPVPGAPAQPDERPAFAEIPADIDPTADLGWTADDLSWLASAGGELDRDDDNDGPGLSGDTGPYDGLRALAGLSLDDAPDDWADLAANPESVTGPLPVLDLDRLDDEPAARARIEAELPPEGAGAGPAIALPTRAAAVAAGRRPGVGWAAFLAAVLVLGIVGGVAGARAVRPLGDDPDPDPEIADADREADPAPSTTAAPAWPASCDVPSPAGPDVDGDGCPEAVDLDGRVATVGSIRVALGEEGDLVALGDWDCDGTATPALLRPTSGEVFVFPRWSLDDPFEVRASTVVPDGAGIAAGEGDCPDLVVRTPEGERTVAT
ncbi:MAG TPA: lipopolysaccharide kinase InaA family protein [Acidimicrobiales bacterium]|nr:lipopolysaccharide kinase InaA family protein [Acidimicrobiales bacterium]